MPSGQTTTRPLRPSYEALHCERPLDDDVLVAFAFGSEASLPDDPRCVRVDLEPCTEVAGVEVWRGLGPARNALDGLIRYADDGEYCIGHLSIDESVAGCLAGAAESAYGSLLRFHADSPYRHVWRIWNYISDINDGAGDSERYRQFCLGRARAFAENAFRLPAIGYPAASAVGKKNAARSLEVCWIASRSPGARVENPRQVSAYEYPREHGPASPSFSRATVSADRLLLVSGTASIVGHTSMHMGNLRAQIEETLKNIDVLMQNSAAGRLAGAAIINGDSLVKVYVRSVLDAADVERELRRKLGPTVPMLILNADICRSDLLIEIEVAHHG